MSKRTFRLASGNALELTYMDGLWLNFWWERKPPTAEDYAEYRRNRSRWMTAVLPSNRTFVVLEDRPNTLGRMEIVKRNAKRSVTRR